MERSLQPVLKDRLVFGEILVDREDVRWVFVGFVGGIPEFVCEDRSRLDRRVCDFRTLFHFFSNIASYITPHYRDELRRLYDNYEVQEAAIVHKFGSHEPIDRDPKSPRNRQY